jgi:hypothetical protein
MAEPPTKRSRNDKDEGHHVYTNKLLNVSPELFDHANSISSKYLAAKPYPHHVLENIFVDGFLSEFLTAESSQPVELVPLTLTRFEQYFSSKDHQLTVI